MDKKIEKLEEILKEHKGETWAILSHKYPDPDSIASQLATQKILKHYEINSDIFAYGTVSHPANKAMVNRLEIKLIDRAELNFSKYDNIMIVDATELTIDLPEKIIPIITVDHHSVLLKDIKSKFKDITEKDRGSTATRIVQYFQELDIPLSKEQDSKLTTALFYGIYSDTGGLVKITEDDDKSASFVRKFYDQEIIIRLTSPDYEIHTLDTKSVAIKNKLVYGTNLLAFAETLKEKEDLTIVVDELIRTRGIELAILYGIFENQILISLRSRGDQIHCGDLAKKVWASYGSAGGRRTAAGASIPLGYVLSGLEQKEQEELVKKRIKKEAIIALNLQEETEKEEKED